jgi:hypothetical protein
MQPDQSERTSRWIAYRRWIQIVLVAMVAACWAFWDFDAGAAFTSSVIPRLSWLDPTLAKAFLFWGLPIGGVALVQLICYSLDRVFLRRRWTSIDLLRLTLWRTVSPTVAILFLASGFNAFYERRLVGIVWLVIAAIVAMLGMLRLRFAEGMKLQEVIRWGTLQTGIRSGEDDEDAFETSVCRSGRQRAPNQRLWGFAHYCSDRQLRKIPDKRTTRFRHWA